MIKSSKLAVLLILLVFTTCEKDGIQEYYYPKLECESDWLTNPEYHMAVYRPPAIKNSPKSFTATVNGKLWQADSLVSASYYKGNVVIGGYNKDYWVVIRFSKNDYSNANIYVLNYDGNKVLEKGLKIVDLDTIRGTVSVNFRAIIELHTSYPVQISQVIIEAGKIENVKFKDLFCRPDYVVQNTDTALRGIWHLIEISNCTTNSQYYPPCGYDPFISFDTLNSGPPVSSGYNNFVSAWCVNEFSPSYEFLNDTTIVISNGGESQVGTGEIVGDFEKLFFSLLCCDTMVIKQNKNLLEIKKRGNIFLRFYK
jgi:hypothetical protein